MENPFRRRAAFELARVLYKAGAYCQHGLIRAFYASALPDNRREVVETSPCCRRGLDASVASQSRGSLVGRPCREGAIGESIRRQTDQGVHDVSATRDLSPFASQRLLGEEDRGNVGGRFEPSTSRHPSTSSGTAGSGHCGLNELGDGKVPEFFEGFRIGGHGVRVGGISRIVLYVNPYLIRPVISGRYFKKDSLHTVAFKRRNSRTA